MPLAIRYVSTRAVNQEVKRIDTWNDSNVSHKHELKHLSRVAKCQLVFLTNLPVNHQVKLFTAPTNLRYHSL